MPTAVRFWVDPACPWCWTTSQWIRRIAADRDLDITWEPISLLVKNGTTPDSPWYDAVVWTRNLLRVMESVRAAGQGDRLGALYTEYGRRIHHEGERMWDAAEALTAVGLDPTHAAAATDEAWDEPLLERMNQGLALVGNDVGTPIISFVRADGREVAAFGPVITKAPEHAKGLALWDAVVTLTELDEFWELKRTRTVGPEFGDAPLTAVRTRVYRQGKLAVEDGALADVSDHLAEPDTVVWVDLCSPTKEQLIELAGELGLHELAVEDALGPHQRPKLDHYDTHLFLSVHAVRVEDSDTPLVTTEIDAFVNRRWIVTVRKDEGFALEPLLQRWDRSPDLAVHGVSFLLYGLLDLVVDGYFDAVQAFDDFYDEVSEGIFSEHPLDPSQQRRWFHMRRALVRFHRLVVPMREAVSALMRREQTAVAEPLYPYFQDVYDHILRVSESTDALRDLVSTIVETNLSLRDYRQNQVMKKVTSWAGIIAVPTLVTGFYGMNVPFPGDGQPWGAWTASGLALSLSVGLYVLFRRRDWL